MNDNTEPTTGSIWRHRNGNLYVVLFLTNKNAGPATYPRTVVYQGSNGERWSRPFSGWSRSMTAGDADDVKTFFCESGRHRAEIRASGGWVPSNSAGTLRSDDKHQQE